MFNLPETKEKYSVLHGAKTILLPYNVTNKLSASRKSINNLLVSLLALIY